MRRKEKEISKETAIETVIKNALVCRIGMIDGEWPYVVPLCFGYHDKAIYAHSSLKGKKIDAIKKNQNVCFELDGNSEIVPADTACKWGMKFQSVIGFGKAVFLDDPDEKRKGLDIIMSHYADRKFRFPDNKLITTAVIKIKIESMTGKQSGF